MPTDTPTERTGIYVKTTQRTTGIKDMAEAFGARVEAHNAARRDWPDTLRQLAERMAELRDAEGTPGPVKADAVTALGAALTALAACERADAWEAARQGLILGLTLERIGVRPFEPHAARGLKTVRSAAEGHAAVHGTTDEKQKRWAAMAERWRELRRQEPDAKMGAIDRAVANEFSVHERTVANHRRNKMTTISRK